MSAILISTIPVPAHASAATLFATGRWRGSPASGLYANYPHVSAPMAANSGSTVLLCLGYLDSHGNGSVRHSSPVLLSSLVLCGIPRFVVWRRRLRLDIARTATALPREVAMVAYGLPHHSPGFISLKNVVFPLSPIIHSPLI